MSRGRNRRRNISRKLKKHQRKAGVVKWTAFEEGDVWPVGFVRAYINNKYQVFVRPVPADQNGFGAAILWLSIKTHDKAPVRDWRDFQRIKNELVGTDCEAMEIYPAEDRLVDASNQYHLWCFPAGWRIPTGWPARDVIESTEALCEEFGADQKAVQRTIEDHHKAMGLPKIGPAWSCVKQEK